MLFRSSSCHTKRCIAPISTPSPSRSPRTVKSLPSIRVENYDKCFELLLHYEGGFVNNPHDPGGMTNLGVTKKAWEAFIGREVDEEEMRALTPEVVGPFYKSHYWDKCHCDDLPAGVDAVVFDAAVNSGPGNAAKWLQHSVGVNADGAIEIGRAHV